MTRSACLASVQALLGFHVDSFAFFGFASDCQDSGVLENSFSLSTLVRHNIMLGRRVEHVSISSLSYVSFSSLSAAYGQSVCWIEFLVYLAADGTFVNGSMEQMRELQQLLVPLGGIPHFGKHFAMDLYHFPALLPRWNEFVALKGKLDPHGRFENRWLSDLFASR